MSAWLQWLLHTSSSPAGRNLVNRTAFSWAIRQRTLAGKISIFWGCSTLHSKRRLGTSRNQFRGIHWVCNRERHRRVALFTTRVVRTVDLLVPACRRSQQNQSDSRQEHIEFWVVSGRRWSGKLNNSAVFLSSCQLNSRLIWIFHF